MGLKSPTWSLVLVALACSFGGVNSTSFRTRKGSSSSSSMSWSSGPMLTMEDSQFARGSQQLPNTIYTRTYNLPNTIYTDTYNSPNTNLKTQWSSKTVVTTHTSHNMTMHHSGDMIIQTPSKSNIQIKQYVQPTQYYQIIPSHVILSLKIADRFRNNAIFILGFLLQSSSSRLTLQQYTSLKIIYIALQRRQVQMYRLLPALAQIRAQGKKMQLLTLMSELSKYLPQYYSCSAGFWASQIHNNVFSADAVLINGHEKFDLFTGITEDDIQIIRRVKVDDEMSSYDESSKLTETLLGRVFVKIFKSITVHKLSISQQLFAIIIRNLPNPDGDVVFEEYVQFIAELAWRNGISNWDEKQIYQDSIEIYALISTMTQRITRVSGSKVINDALIYVQNHFVNEQNYVMTADESYKITRGGGLDITYLLSLISEGEFSYTSIQWKNQLLEFSRSHTTVIETVLKGMNRYGYISSQEILIAFLSRLRLRLPDEHMEIRKIVYSLLTIVKRKILWHVTPVPAEPGIIDLLTPTPSTTRINSSGNNPTTPGIMPSTGSKSNATTPPKTYSTDIVPTKTIPGEVHPPDIGPIATTPSTTSSTDIDFTKTAPGKTNPPDIGPPTNTPNEEHPHDIGPNKTTPGNTHPPDIEPNKTTPGNTHPPDIGPNKTTPGNTHPSDIGPNKTTPGNTHPPVIGPNKTTPGTTASTDIGPNKTTPGTTSSTDIGPNKTTPGTTPSTDINSTKTTPAKMNPTDIDSTKTPTGKTHQPNIGTTKTTPDDVHLPDIGPNKTTPSEVHSPKIEPTATTPGTTSVTDINSTETTPSKTYPTNIDSTPTTSGKTHPPNIGPTTTTPGISYSTGREDNATTPENTTRHPDRNTYPPEDVEVPRFPQNMHPDDNVSIIVGDDYVPVFSHITDRTDQKNVLVVPSITCLQELPSSKDSRSKCETITEQYITTHLVEVLGEDYIQQVLGYKWEEHYSTKIAFLLALLENAQKNPRISSQTELITIINRYEIALKSVATYVFLPLIVQNQKIDTKVIWSTFDVTKPSESYIESHRPEQIGTNMITLPLVNPKVWLEPVDLNNPLGNLLPDLPAENPDVSKLHLLYQIFTEHEIKTLLGEDWNPSVYPNKGALFISVLRILLTRETIKRNTELYTLIQNYLRAIELPSTYIQIPSSYITRFSYKIIVPPFPTEISEIKTSIPETVNPETKMQLVVSELGIPSIEFLTTFEDEFSLKDMVSLPSVICLQQSSNAENSSDNCEQDVDVHVTEILVKTFGINYIQVILGGNAKELYPTRVSLLVALLEKVQANPKIVNQFESSQIIRRYMIALKSVVSYIFLPLIVSDRIMNDVVVWLSYDINNSSQIDIKPLPPTTVSNNIITLPLINPKTWVLSVDVMEPFSGFIPKFSDVASSFAIQIQPLTELIQTGRIYKLLGPNWKASQFPNRGALYISVIYTLLTIQEVKTNTQLYTLLEHYLTAIELSAIYGRISINYFKEITSRWQLDQQQIINRFDPIVVNVTARDDILLPALINPNKDLKVIVKSYGRIFVQTSRVLETEETDSIILPSVNCLQAFPLEDDDKYCEHFPDLPILHSLIKTLGTKDTDELLEEIDNYEYPTMAAYLENFFKKAVENVKVAKEPQLVADIKTYMLALEFSSSYIFLPLLTNYQEIDAELVWLTYDTTDRRQSHMSLHRADNEGEDNIVTLPLVNPKVWLQSVNIEHPFSSFIPMLPSNDPYAIKLRPLVQLFNSGEVGLLLGSNFSPANYPNRGSLFISTLRLLLESEIVQSNEMLHRLVESYFNVIQVVSLYVHIPRSWINNKFTNAKYTWNVDTADLSTALPFPQTVEERRYFYLIQNFLQGQNILQNFDIRLPSSSTYKAEFLIMMIKRILASSEHVKISGNLQAALEYYSAKAELALVANGGVVHWVWVRQTEGEIRSMKTLHLDIGKIFTTTIPLSRLNNQRAKIHYFKLIKFMNDNSSFLKTDDFKYERYPNYGQFLRAYLNHLRRRPNIDQNVKEYMKTVAEYIRNTGPGAQPIRPKTNKINH